MILPGGSLFAPESPNIPPPPPPPTSDDPEIAEAKRRQRAAELQRRGRASTILAGADETLGSAPVAQPRAGASVLG